MNKQETAERFLEYTGITMHFEALESVANLVSVSGVLDPYTVTFVRESTAKQREVLVFLNNMREQPTTSVQILAALTRTLEDLEGATSFSHWCSALVKKRPQSYDASQLAEHKLTYLWRRYCYLRTTKEDLQTIFSEEHFALLCTFWYRYVRNDWPW